jgi:hypothetical protein
MSNEKTLKTLNERNTETVEQAMRRQDKQIEEMVSLVNKLAGDCVNLQSRVNILDNMLRSYMAAGYGHGPSVR